MVVSFKWEEIVKVGGFNGLYLIVDAVIEAAFDGFDEKWRSITKRISCLVGNCRDQTLRPCYFGMVDVWFGRREVFVMLKLCT